MEEKEEVDAAKDKGGKEGVWESWTCFISEVYVDN